MILCPRFDLDEVLDLLPRASVFMGVPTMYVRLAAAPRLDAGRCRTIRLFASGSAALPPATFEEFARRSGHRIVERYGMTETTINCSNPLNGDRRPGTVGPPLPGVSLRLLDTAGREVDVGVSGRVHVRGPHVFAGYWGKPEQTREAFTSDGWFDTGDIGRLDSDGYLTLLGRTKDMIISGGYNVYPLEVENVLARCAGVAESSIIGLPHDDYGEAVTAVVVADPEAPASEGAVRGFAKEHLAGYKVPKRVVFLDSLPRNQIGKVEKTVLRTRFRDLYSQ
jgi:malonyl-CoA/methylmalonyl-CoA synthetase